MVRFKIRFLARIKLARFRANSSSENYLFVALVISMKVREKDEREGKREERELPSRNRILTGNRPTPSKAIVEKEIGGKIGRNATCYLGRATEMATN